MTWSVGQVTLSYSLKYLKYQMIPLSISELTYKINKNLYNNALYIPTSLLLMFEYAYFVSLLAMPMCD